MWSRMRPTAVQHLACRASQAGDVRPQRAVPLPLQYNGCLLRVRPPVAQRLSRRNTGGLRPGSGPRGLARASRCTRQPRRAASSQARFLPDSASVAVLLAEGGVALLDCRAQRPAQVGALACGATDRADGGFSMDEAANVLARYRDGKVGRRKLACSHCVGRQVAVGGERAVEPKAGNGGLERAVQEPTARASLLQLSLASVAPNPENQIELYALKTLRFKGARPVELVSSAQLEAVAGSGARWRVGCRGWRVRGGGSLAGAPVGDCPFPSWLPSAPLAPAPSPAPRLVTLAATLAATASSSRPSRPRGRVASRGPQTATFPAPASFSVTRLKSTQPGGPAARQRRPRGRGQLSGRYSSPPALQPLPP